MFIYECNRDLSYIPGPSKIDWIVDSQTLADIAEYDVEEIFNSFCEIIKPDVQKQSVSDPYKWEMRKSWGNETLQLSFSTFETEIGNIWGGSTIECNCSFDRIIDIWIKAKKEYRSIWIHDKNCNIYTIESFISEYISAHIDDNKLRNVEIERIKKNVLTIAST
jgi:hypothetical protein